MHDGSSHTLGYEEPFIQTPFVLDRGHLTRVRFVLFRTHDRARREFVARVVSVLPTASVHISRSRHGAKLSPDARLEVARTPPAYDGPTEAGGVAAVVAPRVAGVSRAPHSLQNFCPSELSCRHGGHCIL
jgi:hypothetical protein